MPGIEELGLLFFSSFALALLLLPLSFRLARRVGALDHPTERSVHNFAVPRIGGIAIGLAVAASLLAFGSMGDTTLLGLLAGLAFILLTGICDDLYSIRPATKFLGQIAAVLLFISISGHTVHGFGDLFGLGAIEARGWELPLTLFCMVGVINALNLSDGLDGLAGGLGFIACLFLGLLAWLHGHVVVLTILIALAAATLAFLRFNAYPARTFMGDTGSLLIGYLLAACAVTLADPHAAVDGARSLPPITVALVLALPIMDTVLVMTRRLIRGEPPFRPDKTHLHHRLLALGIPHSGVVSVLYGVMFLFGALAAMLHTRPEWLQFAVGVGIIAVVYGGAIMLGKIRFRWRGYGLRRALDRYAVYRRAASVVGRSTRPIAMLILVGLLLPAAVLDGVSRQAGAVSLLAWLAVVGLYPWRSALEHRGVLHGTVYMALVLLLVLYHFGVEAPTERAWVEDYLRLLTLITFCWVVFKLIFKSHAEIFLTSSFELLIIAVAWLVPYLVLPLAGVDAQVIQTARSVCLESIPLLLFMKILIRRHPPRNRFIAATLAGALFLLGARGLMALAA